MSAERCLKWNVSDEKTGYPLEYALHDKCFFVISQSPFTGLWHAKCGTEEERFKSRQSAVDFMEGVRRSHYQAKSEGRLPSARQKMIGTIK